MPDIPSREWYEPPDEPDEDEPDPEEEAELAADAAYEAWRDDGVRRGRRCAVKPSN